MADMTKDDMAEILGPFMETTPEDEAAILRGFRPPRTPTDAEFFDRARMAPPPISGITDVRGMGRLLGDRILGQRQGQFPINALASEGVSRVAGLTGPGTGAAAGLVGMGQELASQVYGDVVRGFPEREPEDIAARKAAVGEAITTNALGGMAAPALGAAVSGLARGAGTVIQELADMAPGNVGRFVRRARSAFKTLDDDALEVLTLNKTLDGLTEQRVLTQVEREAIAAGRIPELVRANSDIVAQELGPKVSPGDFAVAFLKKRAETLDVARAPLKKGYDQLADQVGGELVVAQKVPPVDDRGLGAVAQTRLGPGVSIEREALGTFPGLDIQVKPNTGVLVDSAPIRASAQGLHFALREGAEPDGELRYLADRLSKMPEKMPWRQVNQLRQDIGEEIGIVERRQNPANDRLLGRLRNLYGALSTARESALLKAGKSAEAQTLRQLDDQWKKTDAELNNHFLRSLAANIDPKRRGNAEQVYEAFKKAKPGELGKLLDIAGPGLERNYAQTIVEDILFNKAITREASEGGTALAGGTISGKLLNQIIEQGESKAGGLSAAQLQVVLRNRPQVLRSLRTMANALTTLESRGVRSGVAARAIEANVDGAIVNNVVNTPEGQRVINIRIPRDLFVAALADPIARRPLIDGMLIPVSRLAGRTAAGTTTRLMSMPITQRLLEELPRVASENNISLGDTQITQ